MNSFWLNGIHSLHVINVNERMTVTIELKHLAT